MAELMDIHDFGKADSDWVIRDVWDAGIGRMSGTWVNHLYIEGTCRGEG